MRGLPPNRDAVLAWGIRASLLSYMSRDPDFEIRTTEAATFTLDDGLRMPGRVDAAGVLRFEGSVVLRAHHGALVVPLVGVEIDAGALTIDDPADERPPTPAGGSADLARDRPQARLGLVNLERTPDPAVGTMVFATRLAAEADALFGYNYLPDTDFDPLRLIFAPAAGLSSGASPARISFS
ncbi:HtaA domain-containing protein [Microbacterium deminutum]|uniref:Htaa domain-containing protein n=1 Tax=Microbacterium deminutum TaxID=344164 RepID=A0ABN2QTL0_9MICO